MPKVFLCIAFLLTMLSGYELVINKTLYEKDLLKTKVSYFNRDDAKEIVINGKTGVMWQDDINTKNKTKSWLDAKKYCKNLTFAGYNDWSLPRTRDLETLIDIRYKPAIDDNFKNIVPKQYWTSTEYVKYENKAWMIHFEVGMSANISKTKQLYVRCYRWGR